MLPISHGSRSVNEDEGCLNIKYVLWKDCQIWDVTFSSRKMSCGWTGKSTPTSPSEGCTRMESIEGRVYMRLPVLKWLAFLENTRMKEINQYTHRITKIASVAIFYRRVWLVRIFAVACIFTNTYICHVVNNSIFIHKLCIWYFMDYPCFKMWVKQWESKIY